MNLTKQRIIDEVPEKPGVYFWKNKQGEILYIGKAVNLRKRMLQYFDPKMQNSFKTPSLKKLIYDFQIEITSSEKDSFIKERNYIYQYNPKYNELFPIRSSFPYLSLHLTKNKGLEIKIKEFKKMKNTFYFGPLISNKKYSELIKLLEHLLCYQDGTLIQNKDYDFWKQKFEWGKKLLTNRLELKKILDSRIKFFNEQLLFEESKKNQDVYELLEFNKQSQTQILNSGINQDVFGTFSNDKTLCIFIIKYVLGIQSRTEYFVLNIVEDEVATFNNFLHWYYNQVKFADKIILEKKWKEFNFNFHGDNITFAENKKLETLVLTANENAKHYITKETKDPLIFDKLAKVLNIPLIKGMVILDNSFQYNSNIVKGAAFYLENSRLITSLNRHFNLNQENGKSDSSYMYQNFKKYILELSRNNKKYKISVILCDGGMIQINAVKQVLKEENLQDVKVFGLVKNKKHETEKLIDAQNNEIKINDAKVFKFLSNIQTKIDGYVKFKRNVKKKKLEERNELENIDGIGKKTIEKLMSYFDGDLSKIMNASEKELCKIVDKIKAKSIYEYFLNKR
ncbi:excinuclease ABC subunit C [Metamycoplasma subdolum]|uniref:Excinuclease ABC subunit C n=1 Tax=Metamycoplasma subdolum TaxID=92407 RepID=A0A3L9ZX71_9BACT|nr:GIY-YIG nuclease family protein [Metamycoplasma subdolum]RMA77471.1 excinuclease ABC subunit C [Metamycoplasma subdolum]WPB50670.1 GIY-YIG nuclease family protein [Metamycoplasma subdolum]